jgi:hypothetical protein
MVMVMPPLHDGDASPLLPFLFHHLLEQIRLFRKRSASIEREHAVLCHVVDKMEDRAFESLVAFLRP